MPYFWVDNYRELTICWLILNVDDCEIIDKLTVLSMPTNANAHKAWLVIWRFQTCIFFSFEQARIFQSNRCNFSTRKISAKSLSFLIFWFLISYLYFWNNFFVFNFFQKVKSIHFDTKNVSSENPIKFFYYFLSDFGQHTVSVQLREHKEP